jgi:hypothetical protein
MTQQQLDRAYVGARFQKMHGKRVRGMRCNRFANTASPTRLLARLLLPRLADFPNSATSGFARGEPSKEFL